MENTLGKNPDFYYLNDILKSEGDVLKMNLLYLTITSVSVERSFYYLKLLLSDNRRSLKSENIYSYLILKINNFVK